MQPSGSQNKPPRTHATQLYLLCTFFDTPGVFKCQCQSSGVMTYDVLLLAISYIQNVVFVVK